MKSKAIHAAGRLEQAGPACNETSLNELAQRMLIEATRPPVDDLDPPAVLPVSAEPEHGGDDA